MLPGSDAGQVTRALIPGITWTTPADWRAEAEDLPSPLGRGSERGAGELRRAPGYTDAKSENFGSSVIVWLLPMATPADAPALNLLVSAYFRGACQRSAGARILDLRKFKAELVRVSEPATDRNETGDNFRGSAESYECQYSFQPWTLHLRVHVAECAEGQRHAIVVMASPQQDGKFIWHELGQRLKEFSCH